MGWKEFSAAAQEYSKEDQLSFKQAYHFAQQELGEKKRISGELFVGHAVRVATILAENKTAAEVIIAGILHGVLNAEKARQIKTAFGEEVLALLQGEQEI